MRILLQFIFKKMIKFKKNIYCIFIYMSLYILHICKIIVIIRTHYSNKILIKYIIFGFITKIFFNIVIITIIFFYLSLILVPIILITSENVSELIKSKEGELKVRGCCWQNKDEYQKMLSVYNKNSASPFIGFRVLIITTERGSDKNPFW